MTDKPSILDQLVTSPRIAGPTFPKRSLRTKAAAEGKVAAAKTKSSKPKPMADRPSADGTVLQMRPKRTGTMAVDAMKVRCRPGTFEWRYGRHPNALYHAGVAFAQAWERAGIASAGCSAIGGGGDGAWRGMPDGRVLAFDKVREISNELGGPIVRRLVAYCVEGRTPREIAEAFRRQVSERHMAIVLEQDLTDLARAMNYAG